MARPKQHGAQAADGGKEAQAHAHAGGGVPAAEVRIKPWMLLPVVFTSGAAIMAVEIVGVRLLAPYFGVSVYVWGSILTVFMAALACGYWLGGKIADAFPRFALMNVVVLIGACLTLCVPYLARPVSAPLEDLGERWGPFWASIFIFFLPSVFLAMVSPFAVRLATRDLSRLGHSAGRLYAFSTVGSIFGSWVTTFVLIGMISLSKIVIGSAAVLGLLAGLNLLLSHSKKAKAVSAVGALIVVSFFVLPDARGAWAPEAGQTLVDETDTPYHRILIVDDESDEFYDNKKTRSMHFDRYKESGVDLAPPHHSTSRYTDGFQVAGPLVPKPARALFIGAGGGLGPRTFRKRWPQIEIDVVDIDAEVLRLCEQYFFLGDEADALMHVHARDGRSFVHEKARATAAGTFLGYDFVVLDAFTIGGRIPWHLTTKEFFSECRRSLRPGGVLIMNVIGALGVGGTGGDKSLIFRSIYKTMHAAYGRTGELPQGSVYCFPINYTPQWKDRLEIARNLILVAGNWSDLLPASVFAAEARKFDATGVLGKEITSIAEDLLAPAFTDSIIAPTDNAPLLTDEFCPVETMPFFNR